MAKLPDKSEGVNGECPQCGATIVCRMTDYKGNFTNYLQWQNLDEKTAHYQSNGDCKNSNPDNNQFTEDARREQQELADEAELSKGETTQKSTHVDPTYSRINSTQKEVHEEVWAYAVMQAEKVHPVEMKGGTDGYPRVDVNFKSRMILAQVFYKKNMDYKIHVG